MAARHSFNQERVQRAAATSLGALAAIGIGIALTVHVLTTGASRPVAAVRTRSGSPKAAAAAPPGSVGPSGSVGSATATNPAAAPAASSPANAPAASGSSSVAGLHAESDISHLISSGPSGGVSVAALDLTTGASYSAGAASGMVTASVVKLELLETLLLQHEQSRQPLSSYENSVATSMIENSNNDSAEDVFEDVGDRPAVVAAEPALGLSAALTVPGPTDYWGLTTTSAQQQLVLLKNLVNPASPLDSAAQQYALTLMRNVEADQRWGVGVAADPGTDFANKNGWLNIDDDNGLWAVNSDGVLTIHGQTVLMSVMTQHDSDEATGISLVGSIASAVALAVA